MIIEIRDGGGNRIILDDFQKFPTFGEIVVIGESEYQVVNVPIRHEYIRIDLNRSAWAPVVTVHPHHPSKPTKKTVKG